MKRLAICALVSASCFAPDFGNGELRCAATNPQCPSGYHCDEQMCWKDGTGPSDDLSMQKDMHVGDDLGKDAGVDLSRMTDGSLLDGSHVDGATQTAPTNCAAWQATGADTDGDYLIDPDGPGGHAAFTVYCKGMGPTDMIPSTPLEYLTLADTTTPGAVEGAIAAGADPALTLSNFSDFPGGQYCNCTGDAVITYQKIRLDVSNPTAIAAIVGDTSFTTASSELAACFANSANGCSGAEDMGWGEAGDCGGAGGVRRGEAQIDLSGTGFYLDSDTYWVTWDNMWVYQPYATTTIASSRQTATIHGGGDCGLITAPGASRRLPLAFDATPETFVPALVNGDFSSTTKFAGWTATDDAANFTLAADPSYGNSFVVNTGNATGTLSQAFVVPRGASKLHFAIRGGANGLVTLAQVKSGGDSQIYAVSVPSSLPSGSYYPYWFPLDRYHGATLRISITHTTASDTLQVSGFAVERGGATPFITNPSFFLAGSLYGWTPTGDLKTFILGDWASGFPYEWSISTDVPNNQGITGSVYQCITIPSGATKLLFGMGLGTQSISLYDFGTGACDVTASTAALTAFGPAIDTTIGVSWDLTKYGGHNALIELEDNSTSTTNGWFDVTELTMVTTTNGP